MPEMMRYSLTAAAAAVAALTFAITGPKIASLEAAPALSNDHIMLAADDAASDDDAESAKMGEDAGTESGDDETSETETKKIDQPDREDGEVEGGAPQ
jgi:hypothetical protein